MAGTLFVVATPIGNLEDISARAIRVLREVAVIAAEDTRRTAHLLARYGIATPATSLHSHNEAHKGGSLIARLLAGDSVALVSDAGTPTLSDPGALLVAAAVDAGVKVEPIPGPNALGAALSVSGLAVDGFTFLGFPPKSGRSRDDWFARLASSAPCAVFYEAPHRIIFTLQELRTKVGNCKVVVCREMTKIHEEILRGPVDEVLPLLAEPVGEFTIVAEIGDSTKAIRAASALTPASVFAEFSHLTNFEGLTRRQAVSRLSRLHSVSAGLIYDLIEEAKSSAG